MNNNSNINLKNKVCICFKDKNLNEQACDIIKNKCSYFNQSYYKTLGFNIAEYTNKNNPATLSMIYLINPEIKDELKKICLRGSHLTITDDSSLTDKIPREKVIILSNLVFGLEEELMNLI